ncbi:pilus assembly FimT family protein [Acidithiobacillus thiooxidans]|uniref:pilus assembly FimT family protein n=1 Tax=Acidithiobacillus thiooxidans TaxID=930 RepID=UPI001C073E02|nr:GspH/FimT family pseudopilin [Acidithiobacillus thiooxidans]MBU2842859.1 prepilin-type N-terminal cleavage/methylation domain-containing protein [Acidithiobacillus thiooxidans]MDD2749373.1 GspH/FimT family pseudopilin [Acidithiobacillus sp.]
MGGEGLPETLPEVWGKGFTLIELMVIIAIMAIIAAIAIPQYNIWMVRARIQAAAGNLQQDINWAKGYAIRSGYPVTVSITDGGNACSWAITPQTVSQTLQNVPQMTATQYRNEYQNTPCTVLTSGTFSVTPTGMVYDSSNTVTSAAIVFQATSQQPATYGYWLVQVSGAGDVRSCATASATSTACNLK